MSNAFGTKRPIKPHLIQGAGGLAAEIGDLRRDIDEAFNSAEAQISVTGYVFMLQPGGVAGGNVYTDWASLWAVAGSIKSSRIIQFDDSLAPIVIPAGVYDQKNIIWEGTFKTTDVLVNLADGVELPNLSLIRHGVQVNSLATTTTPIVIADGDVLICERGGSVQRDVTATKAVVRAESLPGGNGPVILCGVGSKLGSSNSDIEVTAGSIPGSNGLLVIVEALSRVENSSLFGPGAAALLYPTPASLVNSTLPPVQPGLTTFNVIDLTAGGYGVHERYSCEALGSLVAPTTLPPGYSLLSTVAPRGVIPLNAGLLTILIVAVFGGGGPGNAGLTVTFELQKAGVPIPGSQIVIDAELGGFGFAQFVDSYSGGSDYLTLVATPSGALAASITAIVASVV